MIKVGLFYDRVIPLKIKIKAHFSWYWLVFKTWVYFWRSRWHFLRSKYFFKTLCELFNGLGALFNNWGDFQRSRSHFFRSLLEIDLKVLLRGWFFDCAFSFSLTHFSVSDPYFLSISGFSSTLYIYFFMHPFSYFELTFKISRQNLHRSTTLSTPRHKIKKSSRQ